MAGIIQSYGLFWRAEDVFWGKGSNAGALLGRPARKKSAEPTDFRTQIGIYVLYTGHQMVYVGQTGSQNQKLFGRLKRHRSDWLAGRWDRFSWFGLRRVLNSGRLSTEKLRTSAGIGVALNHIEAVLITAAEPTLNKQGGRFGKGSKRYVQVRDERLGPTDAQILRKLWAMRSGD